VVSPHRSDNAVNANIAVIADNGRLARFRTIEKIPAEEPEGRQLHPPLFLQLATLSAVTAMSALLLRQQELLLCILNEPVYQWLKWFFAPGDTETDFRTEGANWNEGNTRSR
jgi:hypothetical protein